MGLRSPIIEVHRQLQLQGALESITEVTRLRVDRAERRARTGCTQRSVATYPRRWNGAWPCSDVLKVVR
jgi:hypothetical protein